MLSKTKKQSNSDYLLMGQNLGLFLCIATLTASWYGGIFGVTQLAYEEGFYNFFTQGFCWYLSYIIFALFFVKKIRKENVTSLADLMGKKFGPEFKKFTGLILFFHALPITYSLSLGIFLQSVFGLNLFFSICVGTFLVAFYSSMGGLRGIIITDAFQFCLMFFSVLSVVYFCSMNFGGIDFLTNNLPSTFFNFYGSFDISRALVWFLVATSTTLVHPVFYQRCLAAKDDKTAQLSILISIGFWFLFDLGTTFGGMYAKAILPQSDPSQAYLTLALQILPNGFKGIFVAGIIACILSTIDSFLFVSGVSLSSDVKQIHQKSQHKKFIFLSAMLSIIFACFFDTKFESIWLLKEGLLSLGLLMPCLAAIFVKEQLNAKIFIWPSSISCSIYFVGSLSNHSLQHYFLYASYFIGLSMLIIMLKHQSSRQSKLFKLSNG